jgi:tripartite-type tricarboxylate transporter receptor subunit TctC
MASPKLQERLAKMDVTPNYIPAPQMQAKLKSEIENWTRFIDAKGIKAE